MLIGIHFIAIMILGVFRMQPRSWLGHPVLIKFTHIPRYFFVFFVLCHWWVLQVLTPRMSLQFILFKTTPTSSVGNMTRRTRCQPSEMPAAQTSVLLSLRKVLLPRLFWGGATFLRPWQKLKCKSLQVHNAFGIQIWCKAILSDN